MARGILDSRENPTVEMEVNPVGAKSFKEGLRMGATRGIYAPPIK